jgi:serine/threonine-protein kinase
LTPGFRLAHCDEIAVRSKFVRDGYRPGTFLEGTYCIARCIGTGGMGVVYEASHARLAGRYAVKVLHPEVQKHPELLARFKREAEITSALRHPGIVQVIDFHTPANRSPFLVMEYLDGEHLGKVMAREAPFSIRRAVAIVSQIASALAAAHRQGVVHRDLQPHNVILLAPDGDLPERVKIVDFGISKIRSASRRITGTREVLGTPQYMAPEQAEGRAGEIDAAADQFSLAAIAYEMLTGRVAFSGDTLVALAYQIVHATPKAISWHRPDLPEGLSAVVAKALSKDRRERFPSISEFAQSFRLAAGVAAGVAESTDDAKTVVAPRASFDPALDDAKTVVAPSASFGAARAEALNTLVVTRRRRLQPIITPGAHTGEVWRRPARALRSRLGRSLLVGAAGLALAVTIVSTAFSSRPPSVAPPKPTLAETVPRAPIAAAVHSPPPAPPPPAPAPPPLAAAAPIEASVIAPKAAAPFPVRPRARAKKVTIRRVAAPPSHATPAIEAKASKNGEPETDSGRCSLTVGSSPGAELWIDGKRSGRNTPIVDLPIRCGRHTLLFKREELALERTAEVTLSPGVNFRAVYELAH